MSRCCSLTLELFGRFSLSPISLSVDILSRTLVMPPSTTWYLLNKNKDRDENESNYDKFFDLEKISESLDIISMEEFVRTVAAKGLLKVALPPEASKSKVSDDSFSWSVKLCNYGGNNGSEFHFHVCIRLTFCLGGTYSSKHLNSALLPIFCFLFPHTFESFPPLPHLHTDHFHTCFPFFDLFMLRSHRQYPLCLPLFILLFYFSSRPFSPS